MTVALTLEFDGRPWAPAYMLRAAVPVDRRAGVAPAITARWRDHRVDMRQLGAFLAITGLPCGSTLPLLYPHVFGFRLSMVVLTHPRFPVLIWGVLQTRNHGMPKRAASTLSPSARSPAKSSP